MFFKFFQENQNSNVGNLIEEDKENKEPDDDVIYSNQSQGKIFLSSESSSESSVTTESNENFESNLPSEDSSDKNSKINSDTQGFEDFYIIFFSRQNLKI